MSVSSCVLTPAALSSTVVLHTRWACHHCGTLRNGDVVSRTFMGLPTDAELRHSVQDRQLIPVGWVSGLRGVYCGADCAVKADSLRKHFSAKVHPVERFASEQWRNV